VVIASSVLSPDQEAQSNPRAAGTQLQSTVRNRGIEVEDALELAEQFDI
jgi:hypothetical protein